MNRFLVRRILLPLHETLRGRATFRFLKAFRATERLSPAEAATGRDTAIARIVAHAVREAPYFRDVFAARGLDAMAVRGAADLPLLPVMTKALIREQKTRLIANTMAARVFTLATGGSSGEPLVFWTDKDREASQLAAKLRAREWWGIRPGDRQADLWGSPIEIGAQDRLRVFKDRLLNLTLLSAFELSDEKMAGFRARLERFRPDFLYGYASVLGRYAAFLERRGESLAHLGLKGAVTTAETLFPDQRASIRRAFGCAAINEYGCRDGGFIAQECPEGRLHVASDTVHVELLDGERPVPLGEVGEVAVTNLWSFGMPLIRYKIGDRARFSAEPCPCGRSLPVLAAVEGRVTDTLLSPDGNRVHGLAAMYVLRVLPGVTAYQVIQETRALVRTAIVPSPDADRAALAHAVKAGLAKILGAGVTIEVAFVDRIAPTPSGKLRAIVCNVKE